MTPAARLLAAFEGSSAAYGETTVGRIGRKGKAEAKSFVRRGQMTEEMVQAHIEGTQGIGAIPIRADSTCKFGALDIDQYDLDHVALQKKIQRLKLPLIHCRTKSGGAHLFLFLSSWYQASMVREYLTEMSIALGFSGCEIFPKQDKILVDRGDLGNFINMPYFNADQTTRYAFNADGEAMELEEFLDAVERNRVSMVDLDALSLGGSKEYFTDGYACLRILVATGCIGEYRNNTLFMMGQYAIKKHPDTWEATVEEYNRKFMSPPLDSNEVLGVLKQLKKKDYGPTCKIEPFCSHCDVEACKAATHGIDGGEMAVTPQIGGMTIILSEPRLYFMDVNGKRLELASEHLHNQSAWQKACIEQLSFSPSTMKAHKWTNMINTLLNEAAVIEVSEEMTKTGQFKELVRMYCNGSAQAHSPEELDTGKPWHDGGKVKFKFDGLVNFLRNRQFTDFTRGKIQEELKKLNGGEDCHGQERYKNSDGKWCTTRIWWVPEFVEEEVELPIEEIETHVPF